MSTPKPRRAERLVKALVRAHRWRRQIESGRAKSITDLAEQEGVADAYVCWLLPRAGHHRGDPGWAAAEGLNFADILETWSPLGPHLWIHAGNPDHVQRLVVDIPLYAER